MAVSKKNFFKDHYDWLVALGGLALLAGVGFLYISSQDVSAEDACKTCENSLKRDPAHKEIPSTDKIFGILGRAHDGMASPVQIAVPNDEEGSFLASECRVPCQDAKCRKPIPLGSEACPWCQAKQQAKELDVREGLDTDNDGMADAWEQKYGFNPNNAGDATQDPDGDTFTNLEECKAGTDPTDPNSHPEFLDYLSVAGALREEELPFVFTRATPIPNSHRLTFEVVTRNQAKQPVIGEAVVKNSASAEVGKEIVFELMKIKYVKGRAQDDKVKSGWRVLKYNPKTEMRQKEGSDQKIPVDVSTADLERISDKRTITAQVGSRKRIAIEKRIDLQWNRGESQPITVSVGSKFKLKNREYEVKKFVKEGNACKVTIVDLETKAEKIIQ